MSIDILSVGSILDRVAATLDLPPALQTEADRQYHLVGEYLSDQATTADWDIYPQGSMRLGTVVRPPVNGEGFDLDMVCRVAIAKEESTSQEDLKERVGNALASYVAENASVHGVPTKCEPCRRCWTLYYPEGFHMDVLPAIPDVAAPPTGIELTDKQLRKWQPSDPIAYSNWFKGQMALQFARRREAMATEMRKSIEAIPDWEVKTSLQRVVQILKRHRDLYFLGDPEDRTPSIVITTLVAHAYDGEEDILEATLSALHKMPNFIETDARGNGVVVSPVSDENFVDKWAEYPEREEKFRSWMEQATEDIEVSASLRGIENVTGRLAKGFGEHVIREATKQFGVELHESSVAGELGVAGAVAGLSTAATATRGPKHTFYGREHFGQ